MNFCLLVHVFCPSAFSAGILMPPHDGCPCLRLALPTAKRVASFRQLLPNRGAQKSPPHFEMRRACNFISLRSLSTIYASAFWTRLSPGGAADRRSLNIPAAIFQRPPRKNVESVFCNNFHSLWVSLRFPICGLPKFIVIYAVL